LLPCKICKSTTPKKLFSSATVELGERDEWLPHTSETSAILEETPVNETPEPPTTEWPETTVSSSPTMEVLPTVNETPEPENYREQIILSYDCDYIVQNKVHSGHIYLYASHLCLDLPLKKKQKKYPLTVLHHLS
jgi:hypothetical protein